MLEWLKTWPILVIALISTALMILLHRLGLLRRPKVSGVPLEEDDLAEAHYNLGVVLAEQGKIEEGQARSRAWRLTVTSLCATLCHRARQRRQEHERMVIGG